MPQILGKQSVYKIHSHYYNGNRIDTYWHDSIISLREEVCDHTTNLTPPLFIDVPVQSQESERSCIFVQDY